MSELANEAGRSADEKQAGSRKQRLRELPPLALDVIYIGGFPPFWKIWKKGMMTIPAPESRRGLDLAERGKRSSELPPGKLDVIYIGGFPPVWQIWRKGGMVTVQPAESRRGRADGIEWDSERREATTMAELANREEQVMGSDQAERGKRPGELPPGKLDVIYIGGIPPLRQLWRDVKAIIKERRESPPPLE